eukprot:1026289-Alexandrium_andersonii.AAC.1
MGPTVPVHGRHPSSQRRVSRRIAGRGLPRQGGKESRLRGNADQAAASIVHTRVSSACSPSASPIAAWWASRMEPAFS